MPLLSLIGIRLLLYPLVKLIFSIADGTAELYERRAGPLASIVSQSLFRKLSPLSDF